MIKSVITHYILPFTFWFIPFWVIAFAADYTLHAYHLGWIGRLLGPIGTLVLLLSFLYSLRKRNIITTGMPQKWLQVHEYLAWIGSMLLLVHAGIHFNGLLAWLAIAAMLITLTLGLVDKFILKEATADHALNEAILEIDGYNETEIDKKLYLESIFVTQIQLWHKIHLPVAFLFLCLSLLHIVSIIVFAP